MRGTPRHKTKFLKKPTRSDEEKKIKKELNQIEKQKEETEKPTEEKKIYPEEKHPSS
jgi:hypothetical protein